MTAREARDLFAYNDWANARLMACCDTLDASQWSQEIGGSFPTLLSLVAHIVGAEWIWLRRWKGESPASVPEWLSRPNPSALREALSQVERERSDFLRALAEGDLDGEIQYTLLDGSKGSLPLSTLLRHGMNHSTYHRGQIAAMLRQLGVIPPATDLLLHARENATANALPAQHGQEP
jgi:uncharacterized damage-inducible protein DinB